MKDYRGDSPIIIQTNRLTGKSYYLFPFDLKWESEKGAMWTEFLKAGAMKNREEMIAAGFTENEVDEYITKEEKRINKLKAEQVAQHPDGRKAYYYNNKWHVDDSK